MAINQFSYVLLLSMVLIASVSGDYYYTPKPVSGDNYYTPKPAPDMPKPAPDMPKPEEKQPSTPKPDLYKPKPEEKQPKPEEKQPKSEEKQKLLSTTIAIEGIVYCKSGPKLIPLEGAVARITCLAVDKYGYETAPFSILSCATDTKGYFLATLSPSEIEDGWNLRECKAFLELSPLETCKVPTDVNRGIAGALLSSYRLLPEKKMKLFTVGPFFYTPAGPPGLVTIPNGY